MIVRIRAFLIRLMPYLGFFMSDIVYLKLRWFILNGYKLNLKTPLTFSEKIQWLKLYDRNPTYTKLVDKYEVKKFVSDVIGCQYVIPTLGVWDKFEDIDLDLLPDQFVLKTTNGSHTLIICRDKKHFNKEMAGKKFRKWLKINPYYIYREWAYKDVKPRIIAEKYMKDDAMDELTDYKFFCFNGIVAYCQVIANRETNETIDFYDKNWIHQDFVGLNAFQHAPNGHKTPVKYYDMIQIAEKLSKGIPFVRVDLYSINDQVYFGEMTFYPAAGEGRFRPERWNKRIGDLIELPNFCIRV